MISDSPASCGHSDSPFIVALAGFTPVIVSSGLEEQRLRLGHATYRPGCESALVVEEEAMSDVREGGCACGGVRYRLRSDPLFVHCCHCLNCQRQTGSAFVINLLIETDRVELLAGDPAPVAVARS